MTAPDGDLVLMVKPQFEVGKERVGKGGVVRDPELRAEAVAGVADAAAAAGLGRRGGDAPARCPGPSGNVEYFLWLRRGAGDLGRRRRSTPTVRAAGPGRGRRVRRWTRDRAAEHEPPRRVLLRRPHRARRTRARSPARSQGADRATASWSGCSPRRPPTSGSSPAVRPAARARRRDDADAGARLRAGRRDRRRRHDPARRRADPPAARRCSGVNLGHVGFLAEAEYDDLESTIDAIVAPALHGRGAADPRRARATATASWSSGTWALNEASVEKAARERMLEVVVEIDGRPLSRWGCDGVVCATPTGSTAYNFCAGGPVVWPGVEALLMVPISAHALFARPMVVAPDLGARRRGARAAPTAPACCGATAAGPSTCRPAPGSRSAAATAGAAGAAARGAVHRPAGREVRPAGRGLARREPSGAADDWQGDDDA